jgi:hypothetical protein
MASHAPTGAAGTESWGTFIEAAPICHYIFDRPIVSIPYLAGGHCVVASFVSMGTGAAVVTEIGTSEVGGVLANASADSVSVIWAFPADCDVTKDITARTLWSNSQAASTGSAVIHYHNKIIVAGTTAIAVATGASTVAGASQVDLAANVPLWTAWNTLAASFAATPGEDLLIVMTDTTLTTITDLTYIVLQLRYYRRYVG